MKEIWSFNNHFKGVLGAGQAGTYREATGQTIQERNGRGKIKTSTQTAKGTGQSEMTSAPLPWLYTRDFVSTSSDPTSSVFSHS